MPICEAITKKGKGPKCINGDATFHAPSNQWLCHLHHPDSLYRQQVAAKRTEKRGGRQINGMKSLTVTSARTAERLELTRELDRTGTPELDRMTLNLPPDAGRDPKARLARRWESEA